MLPFLLGAVCAALCYLAAVLIVSGLRLHRVERYWTLLDERREMAV